MSDLSCRFVDVLSAFPKTSFNYDNCIFQVNRLKLKPNMIYKTIFPRKGTMLTFQVIVVASFKINDSVEININS